MPVRYILWSLCPRLSQFSQLYFKQYMGLCVFNLHISLMTILRIRVLYLIIIIKWEVWAIFHCLRLDNDTMVCVVCLSIFLYFYCSIEDQPERAGAVLYVIHTLYNRPETHSRWNFNKKHPTKETVMKKYFMLRNMEIFECSLSCIGFLWRNVYEFYVIADFHQYQCMINTAVSCKNQFTWSLQLIDK